MYNLTDKQKIIVRWFVEQVQAGKLEEEFTLLWVMQRTKPIVGNYRGADEDIPELTATTLQSLVREGMFIDRAAKTTHHCALTGLAYQAVASNFTPPAPPPRTQVTITGSHTFLVNIDTLIDSATQTVQAAAHVDTATKEQLSKLLGELKGALAELPEEEGEAAEAVADAAESLVGKATKDQPNKTSIRISAEGLKKAAENIVNVAPKVLEIARMIIALVGAG